MVPSGWENALLADFAEVKLGKMLSPKAQTAGLVRLAYLRNENVRWGRVDLSDLKEMGFKPEEIERYSVEPGDLLACEGGEPGRAAVYQGSARIAYQKALHRVRPYSKDLSTLLLRYWLEHLARAGSLVGKIAQTTIQHLPLERFQAVELPLPPAKEQRRIVAAIEQQLSRVDAGVEALERVRKELARYRASVLKAACEGRLVPTEASLARGESRGYEPASDLLARILAERRARWEASFAARAKKYPEPAPPDDSALTALPEGWCWSAMDQLLNELRNGVSTVPREESGVPILRISAVRALRVDLSDLRFLSGSKVDFEGYEVAAGDLLFTRYNGSTDLVGVCACAPEPGRFVAYPDKIIRGRVGRAVSNSYLAIAANTGTSRAHIEARTRTTAGQAGVSGSDIKAMPIPLPPLAEQHRIVAEVERRLSIADEVAASVDAAIARAARLRQSVLKRAFEGKLVPQDPNDEPASVLLARIRAEREKAASAKPRQRAKGGVR